MAPQVEGLTYTHCANSEVARKYSCLSSFLAEGGANISVMQNVPGSEDRGETWLYLQSCFQGHTPAFDYDVKLEGDLIGLRRVANLTST